MRDEAALDDALRGAKLVACPHCRRVGSLIGHGLLRGYAERSSERVVRGRRFFCSNRTRRPGCGRTFSVKLAAVLTGFVLGTLALWHFVRAVLGGLTRRAAWLREGGSAATQSSGYRSWRRMCAAVSALRVRLSREAPAPASTARDPLMQLAEHLAVVVGAGESDPLAAYQRRMQRGVFEG